MAAATLNINGQKFRVVPEDEYQQLRAAAQRQKREQRQDAADQAEAERRLKNPNRKTIPLKKLKAELGL